MRCAGKTIYNNFEFKFNQTYFQNERDDAMNRARRSTKTAEKTALQLSEVRQQLTEVKTQLSEAIDYKVMLFNLS